MRRIFAGCAMAALFLLAVLSATGADKTAAPAKARAAKAAAPLGYGNADAISQEELKVYEYFLASDQLEGRNIPSRGYDTAALYVASHLAEWGLKPGGSATGVNGPLQPYFMPMELVAKQVVPGGEQSLAHRAGPARPRRPVRRGGSRRAARRGPPRGCASANPSPRISSTARIGPWAGRSRRPRRGRGRAFRRVC